MANNNGNKSQRSAEAGTMDELRKRWFIIVFLAVLIVACSFYGFWQKNSVPETVAVVSLPDTPRHGMGAEAVVYVSGAVNSPGMYKLRTGSRVVDAIDAAGGLATGADTSKVNLAQSIKDGVHVHIPLQAVSTRHSGSVSKRPAEAIVPTEKAADAGKNIAQNPNVAADTKVNINTADKAELEKLPGIGPILAGRIIEYRQANGPFRDITMLKAVSGIGEAKFNELKDKVKI